MNIHPGLIAFDGFLHGLPTPAVVRKGGLYQPINFCVLVPKPCKTRKFSIQLNVFPMSLVFVTAPFLVQKALKTPKSSFFRVRRQMWCLNLQIRSVSAENRLQQIPAR